MCGPVRDCLAAASLFAEDASRNLDFDRREESDSNLKEMLPHSVVNFCVTGRSLTGRVWATVGRRDFDPRWVASVTCNESSAPLYLEEGVKLLWRSTHLQSLRWL